MKIHPRGYGPVMRGASTRVDPHGGLNLYELGEWPKETF
jgi:hypothetical protein